MYMKEAVVNNQVGLHARPATFFIQKANEFKSSIWVEKDERRVNAKSLLGVLSLGIVKGTSINLIADGPDEKEAVEALIELISSNFFAAIGKPVKGLVLSMTRQVLFLIPLLVVLPMIFGIDGIMFAGPTADFAAFVVTSLSIMGEMRRIREMETTAAVRPAFQTR